MREVYERMLQNALQYRTLAQWPTVTEEKETNVPSTSHTKNEALGDEDSTNEDHGTTFS